MLNSDVTATVSVQDLFFLIRIQIIVYTYHIYQSLRLLILNPQLCYVFESFLLRNLLIFNMYFQVLNILYVTSILIIFISQSYLQCLIQCLAYNKCSRNFVARMNKYSLEWLLSKQYKITNVDEEVEKLEPLRFVGGNTKYYTSCAKRFGDFSKSYAQNFHMIYQFNSQVYTQKK